MFQIGDKVKCKQVGPFGEGIITGVYPGKSYRKVYYQNNFEQWNKFFPKWEEKLVYFVSYTQNKRAVTYEFFKEKYKDILSEEELKTEYHKTELRSSWAEAEDNLELI